MLNDLIKIAENHGDKLAVVSIENIREMQKDMEKYRSENDATLSAYEKSIYDEVFQFDKLLPNAQSIIIVAIPRPAYANVTFDHNGKQYKGFSGVAAKAEKTASYITDFVRSKGYEINREPRLPQKRIAVQSGLAQYGRNNIAYVDGMGSALALMAFSADMPCENTEWREVVVSSVCKNCEICQTLCPTNAIKRDKFHIDSNICLTRMNRSHDDFPDWLPPGAHHSMYYCLMCQMHCPMNKGLETIDVHFDEAETERLLERAPYDDAPQGLKDKLLLLGVGKIEALPRNLRVLFDAVDDGHVHN
ncbi:MAG: hypothetical protein FWE34_04175 [Defluviitaleaceae bacterium]|nr:hypothetical protein [Defluviitaleaceae bacterium]